MSQPLNWKIATEETVNHLVRLIQTETINPPGNELRAILVIKEILDTAGFPQDAVKIVESVPNRANLIARIRGDGSERPLLLSAHVDVVPAEKEKWTHDPFGGEIIDNVVWGRGTIDMKGFLAMYLQVFLELYRQKIPLKRDVILAAIADEEKLFTYGSKFLVEQHPELIDAEFGFTEGGAVTTHFGSIRLYPIQVAEKAACKLRMRVHGQVGHGSVPSPQNPIYLIAQAIEKIRRTGSLPVHLSAPFVKMVDEASEQLSFPMNRLIKLFKSPFVLKVLLARMQGYTRNVIMAWVTNTIFLRILQSGSRDNPDSSFADVDISCGLIPGQTPEDVKREIHQIVGDQIELEILSTYPATDFSTETSLYKILKRRTKQMDPGGVVVPMLFVAKTDACVYQQAGMTVYGFTPGVMPPGFQVMTLAHGHDERIPISYIESGLPVLWDVVNEFCGR